ncbi:MAG: hypothetical protein WCG84_02575 [Candidatus Moraniibacteriota bacterium]
MSLIKKIEHIRQQPEAVRLRYVWLCVSVSMFFVFAIWILSVQTNFPKMPSITETLPNNTSQENPSTTAPSLQEMLQKSTSATGTTTTPEAANTPNTTDASGQ